jgi:hypothetical protein
VTECRRLYDHYGLAYSQEESPTVLPEGAAPTEERPRLRKYVGSPVPAAAEEPTSAETPASDMPVTKGTGPAEPTPARIAPSPPRAIPPEGGFQARQRGTEEPGGPLALLKRRPALPITLAGAIAALIAILVFRRRR